MNSFQRKALYAALAGIGALGAVPAAEAVNHMPVMHDFSTVHFSNAF